MGSKKNPFYRMVVADSRSPRDGRYIEVVGTYSPTEEPAKVSIKEDVILDWLAKGHNLQIQFVTFYQKKASCKNIMRLNLKKIRWAEK